MTDEARDKKNADRTGDKTGNDEARERRLRARVDALLAREPVSSDGSVTIGGRVHAYKVRAEFVPVRTGGLDDQRGEPEAAVLTTSYVVTDAGPADLRAARESPSGWGDRGEEAGDDAVGCRVADGQVPGPHARRPAGVPGRRPSALRV